MIKKQDMHGGSSELLTALSCMILCVLTTSVDLKLTGQFRQMKKDMNVDYVVSNIDFAKAFSIIKWIADVEGVWANSHTEDTTK